MAPLSVIPYFSTAYSLVNMSNHAAARIHVLRASPLLATTFPMAAAEVRKSPDHIMSVLSKDVLVDGLRRGCLASLSSTIAEFYFLTDAFHTQT